MALDGAGTCSVPSVQSLEGSSSINVYASDYQTLIATLSDPHPALSGIAVDATTGVVAVANFYVDGENSSGGVLLGVVSGGCSATTITTLKSSISLGFPGIVAISPADKLVVSDGTLYTFDLPVNDTLGPPIAKTKLKGSGTSTPLSFTASGNDLWTISSQALEYAYPAGGSPVKRVRLAGLSQPIGLIVTPFAQP